MGIIKEFGTVWVAPTYNCNNRCRWCYASSETQKYRAREMNPKTESDTIRLLKSVGATDVKLVGGEPTVYRNIETFIRKMTDAEIGITLITNGRRLSDYDFAERMKNSGLSHISFSIEGHDETTHDRETCVNGSFKEVMEGMQNSSKLGYTQVSNTTITKDNASGLGKLIDLVGDKVKVISFNLVQPRLREDLNEAQNVLTIQQGSEVFNGLYEYGKSKGFKVMLTTPVPVCNFDEPLVREGVVGGLCSILSGTNFCLDYNGDVLPCTLFSDLPFFSIYKKDGELMSGGEFVRKYNEGKSDRIRKKLMKFPSDKCVGCHEICSGGCPLFWLKQDTAKEIKGKKCC
ncbi:MAG: radical SAM protein [Nanoarchaeota archaeon]|nr:radical SAM protein [Nanoarchaeota archaeon]